MSELNTFGAIMTFAIDLETRLRDYYRASGDSARADECDKRRQNMERVRRENVTEIKLEPIEGLTESTYAFDSGNTSATGRIDAEAAAAHFYEDAAPKINVREAQRALERAGRQHRALAGG
jgi:hypothetical protein